MTTVSDAVISEDGLYRYELERWWGEGPGVLWVMLNPSTADGTEDDPTIRRCRGFTESWAHSGFGVVNLFALRSTDPGTLRGHVDPVGPLNEGFIRRWMKWDRITIVVAAWGAWKDPLIPGVDAQVKKIAEEEGRRLWCLGKTQAGDPRHPLYLKRDSTLLALDRP